MSKRTGRNERPGERPGEGEVEFDGDTATFEEFEVERGKTDYSFRVYELLEKMKIDEAPVFTLHKYDDLRSGDNKSFIDRYEGDPPSEHDIGMKHGSGRYMLIMAIPKINGQRSNFCRSYRIRIHPRYDALRSEALGSSHPQNASVVANAGGAGNFVDVISVFERLVSAIAPLFMRQRDPDYSKMLLENYRATNDVLKGAQMEQIKMIRNFMSTSDVEPPVVEEHVEERPGILEQLMPVINQWLPVLLGGGQKAEVVGGIVKSTPQFAAILKNKKDLKSIVQYLDQSQGREKTDLVLKQLEVKRP